MFTGVFKDRSTKDKVARETSCDLVGVEQALAELLSSRELRGHALARNCEIGPFLIDYLFRERSLIVELAPISLAVESLAATRRDARLKFFTDMGYAVFDVSPQELLRHPQRVLAKLRAALS